MSSTSVPVSTRSPDRVPELDAAPRIEAGRRLVEEQQLRLADQARPEVEPPAHAARVGAHEPIGGLDEARAVRARAARSPALTGRSCPYRRATITRFSRPVIAGSTAANWPARPSRLPHPLGRRGARRVPALAGTRHRVGAVLRAHGRTWSCRLRSGQGLPRPGRASATSSSPSSAGVFPYRFPSACASIIGVMSVPPVLISYRTLFDTNDVLSESRVLVKHCSMSVTLFDREPGTRPPPRSSRCSRRPGSARRRERRARRGREPITRELIVDTALRLLDQDGLDQLSMRRVADELDTGAASLYWHVGSKDGLLDLIFDRVIGEIEIPDPEPERWQEQLKEVAQNMRATILRHRDIVRISIGRIPMGPNALDCSERLFAVMRAGRRPRSARRHGAAPAVRRRERLHARRDARPRGRGRSAGRRAGGQHGARLHRSAPGGAVPQPRRASPSTSRSRTTTSASALLIDLYVDGLAQRARSATRR